MQDLGILHETIFDVILKRYWKQPQKDEIQELLDLGVQHLMMEHPGLKT